MPSLRVFIYSIFLLFASVGCVNASAYVGTQDKQLHYDVQTLVEWGYLDVAVNTFPIPWKGIASGLNSIDPTQMPLRPHQAYLRLKHYLQLNKQQKGRQYLTLQAASDDVRFRSFDDGVEDKGKASLSTEFYAGSWSGQISVNVTTSSNGDVDGDLESNLDNSFVAYQFGDWNLRIGSIEQWWGPAQSSSLIMSNNARPFKAIALSRSVNTRSKSKWLSWLGPWYLTSQMGQMEENRTIPNVKLFTNRFNARPFKGFEFGLSWSAMWSGDGQSEGLSEFAELITFQNVCLRDNGGCDDSQLSKRGNHLAGIDISYTLQVYDRPVTIYAQRIGEDAVNNIKVTDNANLFGVSTYWRGAKIFVETSDTNVACGTNDAVFNCYYEHGTYTDGYRMYDRAIGSTFDSDAKQLTLGMNLRLQGGDMMEVYLRSADLNNDKQRPSPVLTDSLSEEVLELSGFYQKPLGKWLVKAGGSVANRKFDDIDDDIDALVYLKAQYAF